jgi:hypothetical protein
VTEQIAPEQWVGPLNTIETMLLRGDASAKDDELVRLLKETIRNLEASIASKRRELSEVQTKKIRLIHEVLKTRGTDPGRLPVRVVNRPHDQSVWIIVGGQPES